MPLLAAVAPAMLYASNARAEQRLDWAELSRLPASQEGGDHLGLAGPFAGVSNDALVIAGGANFPRPVWEADKVWRDEIFVLVRDGESTRWVTGMKLPRPIAYGASVSTSHGVVCLGGADARQTYADAFLMTWDPQQEQVRFTTLPDLPQPCAYTTAAAIGDTVYVAGGTSGLGLETAMRNFWALDLSQLDAGANPAWRELPPWPGPTRALAIAAAQHNGESDCIYVISGRRTADDATVPGGVEFLTDVYEFAPDRYAPSDTSADAGKAWRRRRDAPRCVMAGTGIGVGQSHVLILGGDDGSRFHQTDELKDDHPGFRREALAYHTITDTWTSAGPIPANHVTTTAVRWGADDSNSPIVIPTGEVRPRVRSPVLWKVQPVPGEGRFGAIDFSVIVAYLAAMIGVGVFFSSRNKDADDLFRGGQRVPWFVAGLSIFATMLSSITFLAIPAKAYSTDWVYFLVNMTAIAITPIVVLIFLPFFRRIDATSAYEYLEKRFNRAARLFASASFVLFQIGRMAVVMFLPAIALATITPLTEEQCILLIGVLSIVYCTMGGLEAVVWTDAIQAFVLLGGALFSLALIASRVDGGFGGIFELAADRQKLQIVSWDFSTASYATTALWVVVLGGVGQNLVPYTSDMAVVQRYMSVSDSSRAAKAIWTNAVAILPASLLFFGLGTALFCFYAQHPERLDPTYKTDAIFPLFIARELPVGVAGLVVAGVLAAAQSTISTSMNSTAAAVVTDFVRPFRRPRGDHAYLTLGRVLTASFGVLGMALALAFARSDIKSLWDQFMTILGLFGGSMCGLFCLGIFTTRANGAGAIIGALLGVLALCWVRENTAVHFLLYAAIGIATCFISGYFASLLFPSSRGNIDGLTIYGPARVARSTVRE